MPIVHPGAEITDMMDVNDFTIENRFYTSGKIAEGLHLVDLYMYESSLFANVMVVEDSNITLIIDTGTSESVGALLNYLDFHNIKLGNVLVLPTHHHFDHIGGLYQLIEYLEKKKSKVRVLSSDLMNRWLLHPYEYQKSAKKGFNDAVGELKPIDSAYIRNFEEKKRYNLGKDWDLEILRTPGHCDDHISPILHQKSGQKICFLGEALGINLQGAFSPIPASSAPDFNSEKYLSSIQKIKVRNFDLCIFSHVGGIARKENVEKAIQNAIAGYHTIKDDIIELYKKYKSTREVVEEIYALYKPLISTASINPKLGRNLAFTLVYGILMDQGLK